MRPARMLRGRPTTSAASCTELVQPACREDSLEVRVLTGRAVPDTAHFRARGGQLTPRLEGLIAEREHPCVCRRAEGLGHDEPVMAAEPTVHEVNAVGAVASREDADVVRV